MPKLDRTRSGEKPLPKHGVAAGTANPTLEFQVAPLPSPALAREVDQQLAATHGHTGPRFIGKLIENVVAPGPDRGTLG